MIQHKIITERFESDLSKSIEHFINQNINIVSHTIFKDSFGYFMCSILYQDNKDTIVSNKECE